MALGCPLILTASLRNNLRMSEPQKPEPNVFFEQSIIVRDSYIAECSGVHLIEKNSPEKKGIIINFMEGQIFKTEVPPLSEGWRAIAVLLSPADARTLGEAILKRAT